jgi:hypothetical protein
MQHLGQEPLEDKSSLTMGDDRDSWCLREPERVLSRQGLGDVVIIWERVLEQEGAWWWGGGPRRTRRVPGSSSGRD